MMANVVEELQQQQQQQHHQSPKRVRWSEELTQVRDISPRYKASPFRFISPNINNNNNNRNRSDSPSRSSSVSRSSSSSSSRPSKSSITSTTQLHSLHNCRKSCSGQSTTMSQTTTIIGGHRVKLIHGD